MRRGLPNMQNGTAVSAISPKKLLAIAADEAKHVERLAEKSRSSAGDAGVPPVSGGDHEGTVGDICSEDLNEEQRWAAAGLIEQAQSLRAGFPGGCRRSFRSCQHLRRRD